MTEMLLINGRHIGKIESFGSEKYTEEREMTTVSGRLVTDIVYEKYKFNVTYRFLTDEELTFLINAIKNKVFTATFLDKETLQKISRQCYLSPPNNIRIGDGFDIETRLWDRLTFSAVATEAE